MTTIPGERDPIRVLLADDQALFRAGIAVIVNAQPDMIVVGEAVDGSNAIDLVDQIFPDVVLMDMRMPGMDGADATREICAPARVARRPANTKIIVLTTFALDARAATAIRYGASGFLLKDATPEMLCDAIRTVHTGNAVLAPRELSTLIHGSYTTRRPVPENYSALSTREKEVLLVLARGLSNSEAAAALYVSEPTIKSHLSAILRKLDLRDRVQLVVFAHEHGLVDRDSRRAPERP